MNNIENVYINYRNILDEFTENQVMNRYRVLYQEIKRVFKKRRNRRKSAY